MPGGGGAGIEQVMRHLIPGAVYTLSLYAAIKYPPESGTRQGACTLRLIVNGFQLTTISYSVSTPPPGGLWETYQTGFNAPSTSATLRLAWGCLNSVGNTPMALQLDGISVVTTANNCPV